MNKAEVKKHAELKVRLADIVKEADKRQEKGRGITLKMLEDLRKFADDFRAFGN